MKKQWIANTYHKKSAGIILAKRQLSPEEMDKIVEDYIESEKKRVEQRIRKGDGIIIYHNEK